MTVRRCAVCGRECRGERCASCVHAGYSMAPLWCVCRRPRPVPVRLWDGVPVADAVECARCGRRIIDEGT